MENIVQIQSIISAFIGFGSAVIVAILAGIFQLRIAKRNREIQEKQLEQSREEFIVRMEQSQKEYADKIEQLREEQRKANLEKANVKLQAETNRFYEELMKEMIFYDRLLNELHYLNNIANPKDKEFRIKGAYPHIDNNIKDLIGDVSLHQDIAKLLGALRAKISLYNITLEQRADSEVLEEALKRVYDLIDPINTERFENYSNAQTNLRKHEIDIAKRIMQE
ncbi:hypothetical protein V1225_12000 [Emergencia sp. JLR.KK010]|uniref:hypothetical protein n=1 Tax=Emergencia sp. JLR.KK010 TaxID=3114296 RepID=UPI0030D1A9E9